jgi:hypothetical protein
MENEAPKRMGRPRKPRGEPVTIETAAIAIDAIPAENSVSIPRPDLRPEKRAEDPRARAAKRAAEIRGHLGDMDEGVDDFRAPDAPPGWNYEWKRKTLLGAEDPAYAVSLARTGWEPVPAERHPSYMPTGNKHATIERKGMILMERPQELTDEAREIERRKARNQVRQKEAQLNAAPDGQFTRDHDQVKAKINKTYEAMPVPKT